MVGRYFGTHVGTGILEPVMLKANLNFPFLLPVLPGTFPNKVTVTVQQQLNPSGTKLIYQNQYRFQKLSIKCGGGVIKMINLPKKTQIVTLTSRSLNILLANSGHHFNQ